MPLLDALLVLDLYTLSFNSSHHSLASIPAGLTLPLIVFMYTCNLFGFATYRTLDQDMLFEELTGSMFRRGCIVLDSP